MISSKIRNVIRALAMTELPADYRRGIGFVVAVIPGRGESFRVDIIDPDEDKPVQLWTGNPPRSIWPKTLKSAQRLEGREVVYVGRKGRKCDFLITCAPIEEVEDEAKGDDTTGQAQ